MGGTDRLSGGVAISRSRNWFRFPIPECGTRHGSDQCHSECNIENGGEEDQHSDREKGNNRYQLCVLNDVCKDKEQESRWKHCETAIKRVGETKTMPEDKAPDAEQKQRTSEYSYDPRSPCNVPRGRFVRDHLRISPIHAVSDPRCGSALGCGSGWSSRVATICTLECCLGTCGRQRTNSPPAQSRLMFSRR